jgi:hypothetical protein
MGRRSGARTGIKPQYRRLRFYGIRTAEHILYLLTNPSKTG